MDLAEAIAIIKQFEGCKLNAYKDTGGVWTIGYGSTRINGRPVNWKDTCTLEEADYWLIHHVYELAQNLEKAIKVELNSNEFSALLSLTYNIGLGAFKSSTLLKYLNGGAPKKLVAAQIRRWDKDNSLPVQGLVNRRQIEHDLFLKG